MNREYEDYVRDMLENAEKAIFFVEGLDEDLPVIIPLLRKILE